MWYGGKEEGNGPYLQIGKKVDLFAQETLTLTPTLLQSRDVSLEVVWIGNGVGGIWILDLDLESKMKRGKWEKVR